MVHHQARRYEKSEETRTPRGRGARGRRPDRAGCCACRATGRRYGSGVLWGDLRSGESESPPGAGSDGYVRDQGRESVCGTGERVSGDGGDVGPAFGDPTQVHLRELRGGESG